MMNNNSILKLSDLFYKIADSSKLVSDLLKNKYPVIGYGGGRIVFDMLDGTVKKVARNIEGIDQNKTEIEIYNNKSNYTSNAKYKKNILPILDYDKDNTLWIQFPKVQVFEDEEKMEEATGFSYNELDSMAYSIDYLYSLFNNKEINEEKYNELKDFRSFAEYLGISADELVIPNHWTLINGELFLIDYGQKPKQNLNKPSGYSKPFSTEIRDLDPYLDEEDCPSRRTGYEYLDCD